MSSDTFNRAAGQGAIERAGAPSDAELAIINGRFARSPLTAEQIHIVPAEMSNTMVDSYSTWMAPSSLDLYAAAANGPRGLPTMLFHQTYGTFAVGKWFSGELQDRASAPKPAKGQAIPARDFYKRHEGAERALIETCYIIRNERTAELVEGIEAGIIDSVSVGASINPTFAPGSDLVCDITNRSLVGRSDGEDRVSYFPGLEYEIDGVMILATARYERARQREGSFVPIPGNDFALIRRAVGAFRDGNLGSEDAKRLEDIYGASIMPARGYSMPGTVPAVKVETDAIVGDNPTRSTPADNSGDDAGGVNTETADSPPTNNRSVQVSDTQPTPIAPLEAVRAFLGDALSGDLEAYRAEGREPWEMAARVLTAELEKASAAVAVATRAATEQDTLVRTRLGIKEDQDLATGFDLVDAERKFGETAREDMLGELVRAYTRAHNLAEAGFDKAKFLARRAGWPPADIAEETAELERLAKSSLKAGTVAPRTVDPTRDDEQDEAPASKPINPAHFRA